VDALDGYLAHTGTDAVNALEPWLPELAALFPALSSLGQEVRPVVPAERYRAHRALRAVLEYIASGQPLVLALDDLQWADPASVEAISHLLAHRPRGRVLVVAAFRPAQTPPTLAAALGQAAREEPACRLELGPLSRGEADVMIGGAADRSRREELYRDSGGNPFYLEQLLRSGKGDHAPIHLAGSGVPPPVRAALASELAELSPPARDLLQGAAVAGDPFDDFLAAEAAGLPGAQALMVLDELAERDLIRPAPVPRRFRFRHPIVRRAVYESARPGWRVGAHARLAAALTAAGASAASRAHHVERSARRGDEGAAAVLAEAGQAVAARAPATAAHWYEAAIRLLPEGAEHEGRHLELLVAQATVLAAAGRLAESHMVLTGLLGRLPARAPDHLAVLTFCAAVEQILGQHERSRSRLMGALGGLEDPRSAEAVTLKLLLASSGAFVNDFTEMRRWAAEALDGARGLGHVVLEAVAAAQLGWAEYSLGNSAQALAHLDSAAALFDGMDDAALASRLDLGHWLGWGEANVERYDAAIGHCERAIAVSRATGQGQFLVVTMCAQAWALLMRGRLAAAREVAAAAAEGSGLAGDAFHSQAVGFQAVAAAYAGDLALARSLTGQATELARSLGPGVLAAGAAVMTAIVLVEAGEHERARTGLLAASGGLDLPLLARSEHCLACEVLCRAELALGRVEAGGEWARRAENTAAAGEPPVKTAIAQRAHAAVLLAQGSAADAAELAVRGANAITGIAPVEAGRSRLLAGRAFGQAGDRPRAIRELEHAEQELAASGADHFVEEARAELRRLGRRRPRRAVGPVGLQALSPREREISELVSAGKTNREIAHLCYLSEKTVERHLTHIFAKLGVTSRTAVAATMAGERTGDLLRA
jgi:DNA-binding CsgD family transcriptional regulator